MQTKEFNGYVFAPDSLLLEISDARGNIIDEEVDDQIAFYFPDDEFESKSPEELYNQYMKQ